MNTHLFALFTAQQFSKNNTQLIITDNKLSHRMLHVLRLQKDDAIILFNTTHIATGIIAEISKKTCAVLLQSITQNKQVTPEIHWFLPILDRTDFEQSLYHLTVLGVTSITPYTSSKTRSNWGSTKDIERATNVMISAAEQSKQFVLPEIKTVKTLDKCTKDMSLYTTIFLDIAGKQDLITTLTNYTQKAQNHNTKHLAFIAGPEGDFTPEESALLMQHVATSCTLTSSVLKACDAIFLATGIARTILV